LEAVKTARPDAMVEQMELLSGVPLAPVRAAFPKSSYLRFEAHRRKRDAPSYELALIWHAKPRLIALAARRVSAKWLVWVDAGLTPFVGRDLAPLGAFPSPRIMARLRPGVYFSRVPWFWDRAASGRGVGTCFVVHRSLATQFSEAYYLSLSRSPRLQDEEVYGSMVRDGQASFWGEGYGALVPFLAEHPSNVVGSMEMLLFKKGLHAQILAFCAFLLFGGVVAACVFVLQKQRPFLLRTSPRKAQSV
tara:strand:+ start:22821 stop:23564 length:744 start_codon:yes stop_codon:yes gene_type:complete